MMDRVYDKAEQCCGCGVCADVCPVNAIAMRTTDLFSYPHIDPALCIDCGACRRICVLQNPPDRSAYIPSAFAAKHHQEDVCLHSSSGGAFTALSDAMLERGGMVCGAVFDDAMRVKHVVTDCAVVRDAMRGSKYVQSDTERVYPEIQAALEAGREVLFTGSPCTVAAVKRYFAAFEDLLYTVDIVCHGVPSPAVWERYIRLIETQYGKKVTDYTFRDKQNGWHTYHAVVRFSDGSTVQDTALVDSYLELFRYDLALRPACTACPYATTERVGDVTLGDFWGVERLLSDADTRTGISAVLVNSQKGQHLLSCAEQKIALYPCAVNDIAAGQKTMQQPSHLSVKASAFLRDFNNLPFERVLKKYTRVGVKRRVVDALKKVLRK